MTSSSTLDLVERVTEIDVDGYVDSKGVRYLGRAVRMDDGTWRCLADVGGCLCRVECSITIGKEACNGE